MIVKPENIGGAFVRRTFANGARRMRTGDRMTAAEVRSIPWANRQSLIDRGFIDIYPPAPVGEGEQRIVVRTPGFASKTYDVIAGRKIAEGLTKEQAEALAGGPAASATSN